MAQKIYQVDSFTNKPFAGNPAGVCITDAAAPDGWMLDVAAEMNVSETAFLYPQGDGFNLRWFTPTVEVDMCGHATLATAHILWEKAVVERSAAIPFNTKSGRLTAEWSDGWIKLDFPSLPPRPIKPPEILARALGVPAVFVGTNDTDLLVEVDSQQTVKALHPDMTLLAQLNERGVMVTARSDGDHDFVSRFFAPALGIDEDPVTGSAHCCLGPYWMNRLQKSDLVAYQVSKRGGEVRVCVKGERVNLFGQAVTVFELELKD